MSYRTRLALFFILIVAIPIAVVAVLVAVVSETSDAGKADARIATGLEVGLAIADDAEADAQRAVMQLLDADAVGAALTSGNDGRIEREARAAGQRLGLEYLLITTPDDNLVAIPEGQPVGIAAVAVTGDANYRVAGAVVSADSYLKEVERLTGLDAAVGGATGPTVTTDPAFGTELPQPGESRDATIGGESFRAASAALPGPSDSRITVFAPVESGGILASRPGIVLIVGVILAAGLVGVLAVARLLRSQIAAMLAAAKRIGSGDFSQRVPVVGRDEMAGLASEFNRMTDRLEKQIEQLRRQRMEIDRAVGRFGEALAAGLNRDALLVIVAENAVAACEAEYARIAVEDGTVIEYPPGARGPAREAAVAAQKRAARDRAKVISEREGGHALASPVSQEGREDEAIATLAIGRGAPPFGEAEREALIILVRQAAVSIGNIKAHEEVSAQAVTDELTGLPNNRAFRATIDREASRAERFKHELSLVILDIDNFKSVNDTYGHLQGDQVLRVVGRLLLDEPRAIDEPARYGGEEFVVALPETGVDGAVELAERLRETLAGEEIPLLESDGVLRVTASFGTATMPGAASSVRDLFAAADEALYQAKGTGKNKVVTAPDLIPVRR